MEDDMRHHLQNPKVKFYIGDVRDKRSVDGVMTGVDYIFHAAALKQVPSCEFFPTQAVRTNVLGTENVLDSAIEHGVKECSGPFHRQSCLSYQRHGYQQSHDGKKSPLPKAVNWGRMALLPSAVPVMVM